MKVSNVLTQAIGLALSFSAAAEANDKSRSESCHPHQPLHPLPHTQERHRTCHVPSNGDGTDDSAHILSTLKKCNNGGKIIFDAGKTYTVGKAMDMTFLKHVDLGTR